MSPFECTRFHRSSKSASVLGSSAVAFVAVAFEAVEFGAVAFEAVEFEAVEFGAKKKYSHQVRGKDEPPSLDDGSSQP